MENKEGRNLLAGTPTTNETEIDRSIIKIAILATVGIALTFFFGYYLKVFFIVGDWSELVIVSLAAICFLIIFLLDVFFIKSLEWAALIIFLEFGAMLTGFYSRLSKGLIVGALLAALILFLAHFSGQSEMKNLLKIKFWRIGKIVVPKALTAIALFASIAYYANLREKIVGGEDFFISGSGFEKIIAPGAPLLKKIVPEFDMSLGAGEVINKLAKAQIEENPQAQILPEDIKKQLVVDTARDLEKKISDFLGTPLDPKAKVSDTLYGAMIKKVSGLSEESRGIFQIGLAALIFLTIIGLVLPIRWLVSSIAFLVYESLIALGFAVVSLEGRSKEIIILK